MLTWMFVVLSCSFLSYKNLLLIPLIATISVIYEGSSFEFSIAQEPRNNLSQELFVKIVSHGQNQSVPYGELNISGVSSDNLTTNCTVYIDWNDLKPFQIVKAKAVGNNNNDFSSWTFRYTEKYHLIVPGPNELTAKITCLDTVTNQPVSRWNSINITGVTPNPILPANISTTSIETNNSNFTAVRITSIDQINGTDKDDRINATLNSNLGGEFTAFLIVAKNGNDMIQGGKGNDEIHGDNGNDLLSGGHGDDSLTGGEGADFFYCGTGIDSITDYSALDGDVRSSDCETVR
jgi:RTX calcium-binding nonapeptide repeat (4 copies)